MLRIVFPPNGCRMFYLKWEQKVLWLWWSRRWGNQTLVFCVQPNPKRWCRVLMGWWEHWDHTGPLCVLLLLTPEPAGLRPANKMNLRWSECARRGKKSTGEPTKVHLFNAAWTEARACLLKYKLTGSGWLCYSLRTGVCVCVFALRLKKKGRREQKMEANTKTRL